MSAMDGEPTDEARRHDRACAVALASLVGIGPATLLACHRGAGSAATWQALQAGRGATIAPIAELARRTKGADLAARLGSAARGIDPDALLARHEAAGQQVIALGDPDYPVRLLDDPAPPTVLFLEGRTQSLEGPTVAIVGTRNATRLGRDTATALAGELAERDVAIVSGLALGIDGAAHAAVVARGGGGPPIGVIATGLERAYPRRHELLHRQVAAAGLLVSEAPIGSEPTRWRFPARNRIIAGLSDAVIVVESRSAGGSMLTVNEALIRDRPVLAVPGHPTSSTAAGPLDLIADGAVPVRDVDDVLLAIGLGGRKPTAPTVDRGHSHPDLSGTAEEVLGLLDANPRALGELVSAAALELDAASDALTELEQAGLIIRSGTWFERSGGSR